MSLSPVGPITRVLESGQSMSLSPVGPVTRVLESGQSMSLSPVGPVTSWSQSMSLSLGYWRQDSQ